MGTFLLIPIPIAINLLIAYVEILSIFFFFLVFITCCPLNPVCDLGFSIRKFYRKILFLQVKKFSYKYGAVSF